MIGQLLLPLTLSAAWPVTKGKVNTCCANSNHVILININKCNIINTCIHKAINDDDEEREGEEQGNKENRTLFIL